MKNCYLILNLRNTILNMRKWNHSVKDTMKAYFCYRRTLFSTTNLSRLSALNLLLCSFNVCVLWISFNSITEIKRLKKQKKKVIKKRNIKYLLWKYYWEKLTFSKLRFSKFKKCITGQFLGSSNSRRYHWILKLLAAA